MNKKIFTEEETQKIIHFYQEDQMSMEDIAKIFNTSRSPIFRTLKENEVQIRSNTCKSRKYHINENYFDIIDTPNKAYIIGLLFADGNNRKRQGNVRIELQDTDVQILEDIKKELELDCPLYLRHFDQHPTWHDTYSLSINSVHISQKLANLGMVPNKSLILDFPAWINEELFPFMLKGYIDGDGWIRPKLIGFMSSDKFCYGVQSFLSEHYGINSGVMDMKRHYNEHTKTLYVYQRHLSDLVNLMFSSPTIGIQRKVDKYFQYGFLQYDANNSLVN